MSPPVQQPTRVLIVDDVAALRLLYRTVLNAASTFEVVGEASNGLDGIEKAADLQPDLVMLDLSMPGMDGLEALPRIAEAAPDATVVVASGYGAHAAADRCLQLGAAAYIEKGFNPAELTTFLTALLDGENPDSLTADSAARGRPLSTENLDRQHSAKYGDSHMSTDELLRHFLHDLRGPLSGATGLLDLLDESALEPSQQKVLEHARSAVARAAQRAEHLVEYARSGIAALRPMALDFGREVSDAAESAVLAVDAVPESVRISTPSGMNLTLIDRDALHRIVEVLVNNALKYAAPSADNPADVIADVTDDECVLQVIDQGPGIGPGDVAAVFRPFERGAAAVGTEGSGVGLATSAQLCHQLGGSLSHRPNPGGGTIFEVRVPRRMPDDLAVAQAFRRGEDSDDGSEPSDRIGDSAPAA